MISESRKQSRVCKQSHLRLIKYLSSLIGLILVGLRFYTNNQYIEGASLQQLVSGQAELPFQYRDLIPLIIRTYLSILSLPGNSTYIEKFCAFSDSIFLIASILLYTKLLRSLYYRTAAVSLGLFLFVWGFILTYIYHPIPSLRPLHYYYYPSDLPGLFFWTVAFIALSHKRLSFFYLAFVVGTLNRETTILLLPFFLFTFDKSYSKTQIGVHLVLLLSAWLSIKFSLWCLYYTNSGAGLLDLKLLDNLRLLSGLSGIGIALSACGGLLPLLVIASSRVSTSLRRQLAPGIILYWLGMFIVGNLWEYRVFGELLPMISLALVNVFFEQNSEACEGTQKQGL